VSQARWVGQAAEIILAALLAVGLFASGGLLPILGVVLSLLCPLPLVLLGLRHGPLSLSVALTLATLTLAGPLSGWQALAFLLEFGLPALLLMEGLRRGSRPEVVVTGVAAALTLGGVGVLVLSSGEWIHPLSAVSRHVEALVRDVEALTARIASPGDGTTPLAMPIPNLRGFLLMAFPGLFFAGSLLTAAGYVLLLRGLTRRWPAQLGGLSPGPFRWELPEALVWGFIGSGILYVSGIPWLAPVGLNGLILLVALYFLQGLSIAAFLYQRFKLPRFLVTLSVLLLVFQPFLALVVAGLGLFDVWFAFRRLSFPKTPRGT
jgi:uncharacterized protein YybS (DUF2232 family)